MQPLIPKRQKTSKTIEKRQNPPETDRKRRFSTIIRRTHLSTIKKGNCLQNQNATSSNPIQKQTLKQALMLRP